MGKEFAPSYANILIAAWEKGALQTAIKARHYYRFLDEIWGVWTHTKEEFKIFVEILNKSNPAHINAEQVHFLHIIIFKGPDLAKAHILDTKVYFKPTDTHALLHKTSYHPKHTYAGLITSHLLRFHRICSRQEDFRRASRVLYRAVTDRGQSRPL